MSETLAADVAIVGGGIAGLSAAYDLRRRGVRVVLLESGARPGGVILSERHDNWVVDGGPDAMLVQKPAAVALCREQGITLQAYSPLTRGEKLSHPVVVEIAGQVQRSSAQVLLRWGLQHDFVVLPKSVKPERIAENAALFDFSLDERAMQRLDALEENLVTGWDPATQD